MTSASSSEHRKADGPEAASEDQKHGAQHLAENGSWLSNAVSEAWDASTTEIRSLSAKASNEIDAFKKELKSPKAIAEDAGALALAAGLAYVTLRTGSKAPLALLEKGGTRSVEELLGSSANYYTKPSLSGALASGRLLPETKFAVTKISTAEGMLFARHSAPYNPDLVFESRAPFKPEAPEAVREVKAPQISDKLTFETPLLTNPERAKSFADRIDPLYKQWEEQGSLPHLDAQRDALYDQFGDAKEPNELPHEKIKREITLDRELAKLDRNELDAKADQLEVGLNDYLDEHKLPRVTLDFSDTRGPGNAHFNWGTVHVSTGDLEDPSRKLTAILGHELVHHEQFTLAVRRLADKLNIGSVMTDEQEVKLSQMVGKAMNTQLPGQVRQYIRDAVETRAGLHLSDAESTRADSLIKAIGDYKNGRGPWSDISNTLRKLDRQSARDVLLDFGAEEGGNPAEFDRQMNSIFGQSQPPAELRNLINGAYKDFSDSLGFAEDEESEEEEFFKLMHPSEVVEESPVTPFNEKEAFDYLQKTLESRLEGFAKEKETKYRTYYDSPIEVEARAAQSAVHGQSTASDSLPIADIMRSKKFAELMKKTFEEKP